MIPVDGAGLIAGMALAINSLHPNCLVIGVEPTYCAYYTEALKLGKPSPVSVSPTLGDALAVSTVGPHSFEVARKFVDKVVTVSEKYLALDILRCLEHEKCVEEGGGAAGLAELLTCVCICICIYIFILQYIYICMFFMRQHTSVYVSIRHQTSAYVSIRQHTSAYATIRQHTSAYVSIQSPEQILF